MADEELRRKYHELADPVIGSERAGEVERTVDVLDQLPRVEDLLALLRFPAVLPRRAPGLA